MVNFVAPEDLLGGQITQVYRIDDLTNAIPDFPGKEINLSPSNGLPEVEEELPERDFLVLSEEDLETLIRASVDINSWDNDPNNSLSFSGGQMVISQTPENQIQIQELLDDLREAIGIMVDIETRFLTVEDNFLEDIGVEFHGLGSPAPATAATSSMTLEMPPPSAPSATRSEPTATWVLSSTWATTATFAPHREPLRPIPGRRRRADQQRRLQFQWVYLNDLQLELILTAVSKSERVELVTATHILIYTPHAPTFRSSTRSPM